jgi:protein TonB
VRCDECKTEPLTPGHFCECCGRKLSIQERQALAERTPPPQPSSQTSWGEPAPVLPKRDRLVGVHFDPDPEPYVDEVFAAPSAPYADPLTDPLIDARFASLEAAQQPTPPAPVVSHAGIDPILEAHFAGHVPVDAAPNSPVAVPVPVAPVPAPHVGETHAALTLSVDAPPADVPAAHLDSDAPAARCESCGGPADDGNLCSACQHAFHSLLDNTLAAPGPAVAAASEIPVPPVPAPVVTADAAPTDQERTVIRVKAAPPAAEPPAPEPAPHAEPAPAKVKAQKPVVASASFSASPSGLAGHARTIGGTIAVVVVLAAIGFPLGKLWLGQETSPIVRETTPALADQQAAAEPEHAATSPSVVAPSSPVTPALDERSVEAPRVVPAMATLPKPAAPPAKPAASPASRAAARVPPKGSRPMAPVRPVTTAPAPSPVVAAPAPEVVAPAPVVAAPKPEPPAVAVGPFFELRDVNETPRVATRVEPQVPDELRDRELNEVVIVRVLVTQSGQPSLVNLLRRSKAGPALDDAIVAAVKQWTFVPAKKRGASVSCWFHVGVPVSRAN